VRVIEARSTSFKIVDGDDVLAGVLAEGLNPDSYVYHPAPAAKRISYITDMGRADFTVRPGQTYDFAIRYQGRLYPQRIAASDPRQSIYVGSAVQGGVDTFQFRLGPNNAIHIGAYVNDGPPLGLIFDTGASIGVLSDEGAKKGAKVRDGNVNTIRIGDVTVRDTPVRFIDYRGSLRADGVIGFNAFAGKVVEIDYGAGVMRVRPALPPDLRGYRKLGFTWRESNTLVPLRVDANGRQALALFDTGSRWSLSVRNADPISADLRELPALGTRSATRADGTRVRSRVVELPVVELAGWRLERVQADVEEPGPASALPFNILGNDFLKRFDLIIDYRSGEVYLRPNRLRDEPYNSVFDWRLAAAAAAGLLVLGGAAFILWRRRRRRSRRP
jgi:hypothetical protein